MDDFRNISPKLLSDIQQTFSQRFSDNAEIIRIIGRIRSGDATLLDASKYSTAVGQLLGKVLSEKITFDKLPDGKLYWNIANDVIKPMIEQNHDLVTLVSEQCRELMYEGAKIGIKIKPPDVNQERLKGLLNDLCEEDIDDEQLAFRLESDTANITESFYDDFVEENAAAASSVGLTTKVIRVVDSAGCCAWCDSLAGVYDYDEVKDTGNDVWLRHVNCNCDITWISEKRTDHVDNYRRIDPATGKALYSKRSSNSSGSKSKKRVQVDSVWNYIEDELYNGKQSKKK